MREGVDALERRARALREELESRDGMLEAVQTQAKMDVEDARRERDEARREAKAEKTMRMEAAAMALTALEAKARSEAAMEARDEATPREGEARRELEDAEARLKRAEEAARARGAGDGDVALTPGRSPSAASFAKKVALVEARVRVESERVGPRAGAAAAAAAAAMVARTRSTSNARAVRRHRRRRIPLRTTATRRSGRTREEPRWSGAWRRAKRIRPSSSS